MITMTNKMHTESEVRYLISVYASVLCEIGKIHDELEKIAKEIMVMHGDKVKNGSIAIDGDTVYFSYGGYSDDECDPDQIIFPLPYLWSANWRDLEKQNMETKKKEELERREEEDKIREQRQEKYERGEYERLKKKFGV